MSKLKGKFVDLITKNMNARYVYRNGYRLVWLISSSIPFNNFKDSNPHLVIENNKYILTVLILYDLTLFQ